MAVRETKERWTLKAMVYGQGGTGKTRFLGSFNRDPRTAPILILNCGGNPISILDDKPEPFVVRIETGQDLDDFWLYLKAGQPKDHPIRRTVGIPDGLVFKSVGIDHLSEVQRRLNAGFAGVSMEAVLPTSDWKLSLPQWGQSLTVMMNIVSLYYTLPVHCVINLQENQETDKANITTIGPFLQGKAVGQAPSLAEIVGRMVRRAIGPTGPTSDVEDPTGRKIVSVLYWETTGRFAAKNQVSQNLGKEMIEPTATKLFDLITGPLTNNQSEKEN